MINPKRKLSPSPGTLSKDSRRTKTWSYTMMRRESPGRGGCGRGHGRIHGEREAYMQPVRTTMIKMNEPTKQNLSSLRQILKMPYLTLAQVSRELMSISSPC